MCSLGDKLKTLRQNKELSQEKLCDILNNKYHTSINKGMMSKWENDKEEPRMEFIRNFALFYNVSLDYLLGIDTIAASRYDDNADWTDEELQDIEDFKKYVLSKRNKKDN